MGLEWGQKESEGGDTHQGMLGEEVKWWVSHSFIFSVKADDHLPKGM